MNNKVFVGGLSWNTTEDGLRSHFAQIGEITEVKLVTDRETGRSRGFGFVSYSDSNAAHDAIERYDGTEFDGRTIRVNLAQDRKRHEGGGSGSPSRGGHSRGGSRFSTGRDYNR